MIPRILHYCFGMMPDFGGKPWSLVHYVCLKSAVQHLRPSRVYFWCEHVPRGPWWDLISPSVNVVKTEAPRTIFGKPLLHVAHRADVVRLEKLIEYGGIYLDADVFVHRDFDDLLSHQVVMGKQAFPNGEFGLCNAVILAERGAPFLLRWRDAYKSFRSTGRDEFWDEHSVRVPGKLAAQAPHELTVLPQEAFFWPSWTDIGLERLFHSTEPIASPRLYANHLWEAQAWDRYLRDLTPRRVRRVDSNFHLWARDKISDLPDDLGRPSALRRAATRARSIVAPLKNPQTVGARAWHAAKRRFSTIFPNNILARRYRQKTFSQVYRHNLWGSHGDGRYFSGVGSVGRPSAVYVATMAPILAELVRKTGNMTTIVDLGCGDFRVGASLVEQLPAVHYIGCDIVPDVIAENMRRHGNDRITFRCLDIVTDELPPGHIYLLRQVLQHLPNRDIIRVLDKLREQQNVYITEGQPQFPEGPPNPDKTTGAEIRFDWKTGNGRGVEIDKPPFDIPVHEICRVSPDPDVSREIIVTYQLQPIDERSARTVIPVNDRVRK